MPFALGMPSFGTCGGKPPWNATKAVARTASMVIFFFPPRSRAFARFASVTTTFKKCSAGWRRSRVYNPLVAPEQAAQEEAPVGRLWGLIRGRLSREERREVYQEIRDGSTPSIRFYTLIILSTIIAAYGLLSNSTAVVIGAMLVAPLMGPIFGLALALISGNFPLLKRALLSTLIGVLLTVAVAFVIGLVPLNLEPQSEMLSRTAPTLYDLVIAVASGLAGAYAMANPKVAAALPGVAVSVALAPPLAACGLFLAIGSLQGSAGAFLLFLTNLFGIQLAACGVFLLYDLGAEREVRDVGLPRFLLRFAPSFAVLGLMTWYLTVTLVRISEVSRVRSSVVSALEQDFVRRSGARLDEVLSVSKRAGRWEVVVSALTPRPFEAGEIARLQGMLQHRTGMPIHLIVRSLQSHDADASGPVFALPTELERNERLRRDAELLARATENVQSYLQRLPGAALVDLSHRADGDVVQIQATVTGPEAVEPDQVRELEELIRNSLGRPVNLEVRSLLSRSATAQDWLYVPKRDDEPAIPPEELALRSRIDDAVRRRLEALPGARVKQVSHVSVFGARIVRVALEAPSPPSVEVVSQLQLDLRSHVAPGVTLEVRTELVIRPTQIEEGAEQD